MERQRPLVPKPFPKQSPLSGSVSRKNGRQREAVTVACDNCRKRKTACGGERPACALCQKKRISCQYQIPYRDARAAAKEGFRLLQQDKEKLQRDKEKLQQDKEKLQRELDTLRQSSAVNQSKTTTNSRSLAFEQFIEHRDRSVYAVERRSLTQFPSAIASARAILPPIYSEIEMLLHVQYPLAYPLAKQQIRPNPCDAHAFVYGLVVANHSRMSLRKDYRKGSEKQATSLDRFQGQIQESISPFRSFPVDSNLYNILREEDINIRQWTHIPISVKHVLGGIKLYLETDHPVLGILDARLFLRDFISGSNYFCSSFLVNSFLAYILLPYLANQEGQSLLYKEFQTQAKKQWQEQDSFMAPDHITTMAGLVFLSIVSTNTFDGELGRTFLQDAVDMATRLRLFNTTNPLSIDQIVPEDKDNKQAIAHSAWGVYNVIAVHAIFYFNDPPKYAPLLPLPECHEDYRVYLQSGESIYGVSTGTSQVFIGMCKLCLHIAGMRSDKSKNGSQLQLALSRFNKILAIQNEITKVTGQNPDAKADTLIFNIWYHVIIMDLFRPFILESRQYGFHKPVESPTLPEAVFSASVKQLQDLILDFSMNHLGRPQCCWWNPALLYVANAALCDVSNPEWYPLFLLCIRCYQNILVSYPVIIGFLKALLAMAVEKRQLTLEQVRSIMTPCEAKPRPSNGFGVFMVDLDKALVLPGEANVDTLATQIEAMDVFDQWTQNIIN